MTSYSGLGGIWYAVIYAGEFDEGTKVRTDTFTGQPAS